MESISSISPQVQSASQKDSAALSQDFDNFLLLLTTQLQNQDPLSPVDSTDFTNQLVSFSGVEQQIKSNKTLEDMLALNVLNITSIGLGFVGMDVDRLGSDITYDGSTPESMGYQLSSSSVETNINIVDENGNTVFSTSGETAAGEHHFTWNGLDNNGQPVPAGGYQLQVGATDEVGEAVELSTTVTSLVTGIESGGNGDVILVLADGGQISITDVKRAQQPSS